MNINVGMKLSHLFTVLSIIFTRSKQYATNANTVCKTMLNESYPVDENTKVKCFCTYDGSNQTSTMTMFNDGERQCLSDGTWSGEVPLCANYSSRELHIDLITLEDPRNQVHHTFTIENMTLLPIYASGAKYITLYIVNQKTTVTDLGLSITFGNGGFLKEFPNIENTTTFGTTNWKFDNIETIKQNLKALNGNFQLRVIFKPLHVENILQFSNVNGEQHYYNFSRSNNITFKINLPQPSLISGVKLQLTWTIDVVDIKVNNNSVKFGTQWEEHRFSPVLTLKYPETYQTKPKQEISTSRVNLTLRSWKEKSEWPLQSINVFGDNGEKIDLDERESEICVANYCLSIEKFKKRGRYMTPSSELKLNIILSLQATIQKIQIWLYDTLDVHLRGTNGYVNHDSIKRTYSFSGNNTFIEFWYATPVHIDSEMKLTLASPVERANWPIQNITLLHENGYPVEWCPKLINITKVVPTKSMCIHFAGEEWKQNRGASVRLNYTDANERCATVKGKLVESRTKNIQMLLEDNANTFAYYWIGLHYMNKSLQWISGDPFSHGGFWVNEITRKRYQQGLKSQEENLLDKHINGDCVALYKMFKYQWYTRHCNYTNKYICQSGYMTCGYPDKKDFASITMIYANSTRLPEATYSCPEEFTLKGVVTRKCHDNGTWSHEAPTCIKVPSKGEEYMSSMPQSTIDDSVTSESEIGKKVESERRDMNRKNKIYLITGIGSASALILAVLGAILICRMRKSNKQIEDKKTWEDMQTADSETMVSYEGVNCEATVEDRNTLIKSKDVLDVKNQSLSEQAAGLALPPVTEERHSHMGDYVEEAELYDYAEIDRTKKTESIIVENELYGTL